MSLSESGGTDDLAQNKSAIIKLGEIREIINKVLEASRNSD